MAQMYDPGLLVRPSSLYVEMDYSDYEKVAQASEVVSEVRGALQTTGTLDSSKYKDDYRQVINNTVSFDDYKSLIKNVKDEAFDQRRSKDVVNPEFFGFNNSLSAKWDDYNKIRDKMMSSEVTVVDDFSIEEGEDELLALKKNSKNNSLLVAPAVEARYFYDFYKGSIKNINVIGFTNSEILNNNDVNMSLIDKVLNRATNTVSLVNAASRTNESVSTTYDSEEEKQLANSIEGVSYFKNFDLKHVLGQKLSLQDYDIYNVQGTNGAINYVVLKGGYSSKGATIGSINPYLVSFLTNNDTESVIGDVQGTFKELCDFSGNSRFSYLYTRGYNVKTIVFYDAGTEVSTRFILQENSKIHGYIFDLTNLDKQKYQALKQQIKGYYEEVYLDEFGRVVKINNYGVNHNQVYRLPYFFVKLNKNKRTNFSVVANADMDEESKYVMISSINSQTFKKVLA